MPRSIAWMVALALAVAPPVLAQQGTGEHEQHHPAPSPPDVPVTSPGRQALPTTPPAPVGRAPPAPASSAIPAAPTGTPGMGMGMPGMMQQMMRGMMGPPVKPLYPSMMTFPSLDQGQRAELLEQARQRVVRGAAMIEHAQVQMRGAASVDQAQWGSALVDLREGLKLVESGTAARTALEGNSQPAGVALDWFKRELGLAPPVAPDMWHWWMVGSTFHVLAMTGLSGFGLLALIIWWRRSRRVSILLGRLHEETRGAPPTSTVSPPAATSRPLTDSRPPASVPPPADAPSELHPAAPARAASWQGKLRVAAIFQETPAIKTFRLVEPGGRSIPFDFLPGQFLWIAIAGPSGPLRRSYTIASSPTRRDFVEITVKREDKGAVSTLLHTNVSIGDLVEIEAPRGHLTFTGAEADSIVLIGGGVGATPLMAVLRYLTDRGWPGDIFYLYSCRASADFVFREEIEQIQRRHANVHVLATMTRSAGTVWMGPEGRITKELMAQFVPRIAKSRIHICGPEPMMAEMRRILEELGVPKTQVKTEAFGTSKRAPATSPRELTVGPSAATATVRFTRSARVAPLPAGMSVLEAAESVGVFIENSCRSGTCGSCKVRLLSGQVSMAVEDALDPSEKAEGWVLACQAQSDADVTVEA